MSHLASCLPNDSYPSGLGRTLWSLYHGHFQQNLDALLRVLLDEHRAGWSTINGADFSLLPGLTEPRGDVPSLQQNQGVAPICYCHGYRHEDPWSATQENASGSGCEWAYAFVPGAEPRQDVLLVLSSYTDAGRKMIGFFGQGDPRARWMVVRVLALHGALPDWGQLDSSIPLSPLSTAPTGKASYPLVVRDDRPGTYAVRLSPEALHYVGVRRAAQGAVFFCTCSPEEAAPSPECPHVVAVRSYREEQRAQARQRRANGLEYSGGASILDGQGTPVAFVWHGGTPDILLPHRQYVSHFGFERPEDSSSLPLALAILCDFCGDEELALAHYRSFDHHLLAPRASQDCWQLGSGDITAFLGEPDLMD